MLNKFLLIVAISFAFCFNAQAFVKQSASKALSYKNVATSKPDPEPEEVVVEPEAPVIPAKEVDMKQSVLKNVSVLVDGKFIVFLKDKEGHSWKVSFDRDVASLSGNISEDSVRKMTFVQRRSEDHSVYFDLVNSEGVVVLNKVLHVKAQ